MLVLSRRSKDRISFPEVGITVHFIRIQSGTAKVGIDAPMHIQIVRDEVCPDQAAVARSVRGELLRLPREVRHAIRNELHAVSVGVHLLKEQLKLGMEEDALETFTTIQESLRSLDENHVLRRAEPAARNRETKQRTVLVVEDEANERELLAELLRLKGYDVASAADGEEALEYLATHEMPAVILMDVKLPRRDGPSALREIRTDDNLKEARVFAISGTSPEEVTLEPGLPSFDEWFPKPINVDDLMEAMSGTLQK